VPSVFWDVHSHVIPSGDDGVGSVDEGLGLCREAAARGTSVLFGTPHVWPHLTLTSAREDEIRARHAEMAPQAAELGLDLRLGFELTPDVELLEQDLEDAAHAVGPAHGEAPDHRAADEDGARAERQRDEHVDAAPDPAVHEHLAPLADGRHDLG
jgi:hypothetical protein